jgi:hypothetical protein
MDILAILRDKLDFIRDFYKTASAPFLAIKSKIENQEDPFTYDGGPTEEPPHLLAWTRADESLNILGECCLSLVQRSFKDYLMGFIKDTWNEPLPKGNDWFKTYNVFFRKHSIDWEKGPVDMSLLEELNLARNTIQHWGGEHDIYRIQRTQNAKYYARFPQGLFVNEVDKQMWSRSARVLPARIEVTSEKLQAAIQAVDDLCCFIDQSPRGGPGR